MPTLVKHKLNLADLDSWYKSIETKFLVINPKNAEFRELCNAKENVTIPVYSWYNLKEAYSHNLPKWVLNRLREQFNFVPLTALDPFVGGGTSLVSLRNEGIESFGVEYNPFIAWVSSVKARWEQINVHELLYAVNAISLELSRESNPQIPSLSTFLNSKYFSRIEVKRLVSILTQIDNFNISTLSKDFLKIGVASIIEDISDLKKDGRALRYVEGKRKKVADVLKERWFKQIFQLNDIRNSWRKDVPVHVYQGNSVNFSNLVPLHGGTVDDLLIPKDLIIYSPPYLNNFDYSEVYKLELWLLGFIHDPEEWRALRRGTVRSHHSVKFGQTNLFHMDPNMNDLAEKINGVAHSHLLRNHSKTHMPEVIKGYFHDMYCALVEQYALLKEGGFLVYNVANSKHAYLPIATDVILAEIAIKIGFQPLELIVVHKRNGRTNKKLHLRESIIIMRKPVK